MRARSAAAVARENERLEERRAATLARLARLEPLAPNADRSDLMFLARQCTSPRTFEIICRVLEAR